MKKMLLAGLIISFLSGISALSGTEEGLMADLVLYNGKIFTVDTNQPWAMAVAIRDGKFIAVGSDADVKKLAGKNTEMVDLKGRLALPGFNDAHVHFANGGLYLLGIDLRPARDEKEFVSILKVYIGKLPKGEWVTGGNWDHENWPSKKHPHKSLIDAITPDHPVLLQRLDGHMSIANSLALKLAGITSDTPSPEGGEIVKDKRTGEPTGILRDTAIALVDEVIPPLSRQKRELAIRAAMRHARELGVTSIQDNSSSEDLEIYQDLLKKGELAVRVNAWRGADGWADFSRLGIQAAYGGPFLRLGTVKLFVDGSMGAGTALFFEPYADDPSTCGLPIHSQSKLNDLVRNADRVGLQIAAHAIGDKANAWILEAFALARKKNGVREARHRIEHAQVVRAQDCVSFKELGAIASIQPSHCIDDMRWAEKRIGARVADAYRFASFLAGGVRLAFGTDWDVEPLDPRLGLYAAVSRELPLGGPAGGWHPAEKLSLAQAIEMYTMGSAYAEFQEKVKGSITPGKFADLVVMEKNLFEISKKEILITPVVMTVLAGKIVFKK
ncbi:MAG: amidohydrolase [Acidobacteria bacterium]|nr:amidohydrolase [Acidobacteriota bacterium]MBU4307299.1 amidohydrolase [Acidobacteriota bacterium]MCG2811307.1 amidohydrolase [Candidatus Aminicenantes bacterium]